MEHVEVKSRNIASVAYDKESGDLEVQFKNGRRYRYQGVSPELHAGFMAADSKGAFFSANIRSTYKGVAVELADQTSIP